MTIEHHNTPQTRTELRAHARQRAWERYGLDYTSKMRHKLEYNIAHEVSPFARCLGTQSRTRSIWYLKCDGKEYVVVYDQSHGTIVTFLPFETLGKKPNGTLFFRGFLRPTLRQLKGEFNVEQSDEGGV
jgi:hypothetical protein